MIERALAGFVLAAAVSGLALRSRALAPSGAAAAVLLGTVCVAAGWTWGILLVAFFVASTALSPLGGERKRARTDAVVEKGGARDAAQVLANGGVFAAAAVGWMLAPSSAWMFAGAGALAAATSDTWATEVGTAARGVPRSIVTWRPVAPGTSGGISLPGTAAAVAGAVAVALAVHLAGWPVPAAVTALGGVAGSTTDSLLGAMLQSRRWCGHCDMATERTIHHCGTVTRHVGGAGWLENDGVNLLTCLTGAAVAVLWAQ